MPRPAPVIDRSDPLLYDVPTPLRREYFPLGFSLVIEANSPLILKAADDNWGAFQKSFDDPALRFRIAIHDPGGYFESLDNGELPEPVFRGRGHLVAIVSDAFNFVVCDMTQGFAYGWFTSEMAANTEFLRYHFLTSAVHNLLLGQRSLAIVHSAFVAQGGCGILLCGESGSGKSSLAYACARRGWTYITDDASYVLRNREGRSLVGNPHMIRFRDDAGDLFPELKDRLAKRRPNGKMAIEIPATEIEGIRTAPEAVAGKIVFLKRGEGAATLTRLPQEYAIAQFERDVYFRDPEIRSAQIAALRRLAEVEVYELRYGDLDSAVSRLSRLARGEE